MDRKLIYGIDEGYGGALMVQSIPVVKATAKQIVVDRGEQWTGWRTHLSPSDVHWSAEAALLAFIAMSQRSIETSQKHIEREQAKIDRARALLASTAVRP